jgi:hypothetical protein
MCLVCTDWQKGKLSAQEAIRNLTEMVNTSDKDEDKRHYSETISKVKIAEHDRQYNIGKNIGKNE